MPSTIGKKLNITVWGESHSPEIGITIKGLPKGLVIDLDEVQRFLDRRKGGQNAYSTKRQEADKPFIKCGVTAGKDGASSGTVNTTGEEGISSGIVKTTGEDLTAIFYNSNVRKTDYEEMKYIPRPSHADYTSYVKYGDSKDRSGGGMFSGRLTLPLCFAGAVCMNYLRTLGIDIFGHVSSVGPVEDDGFDLCKPNKESIGKDFPVINVEKGAKIVELMTSCAAEGDSVGGSIECAVTGLKAGIGEPLYDSMESVLSHYIFGIPAVKGIEFGSGFKVSEMKGSECNDPFIIRDGKVATKTNHSGGIQGGISNGMPVIFRVAIKPTPSIYKEQQTVNMKELTETTLSLKGRHDPCIVPRALPCVEAVTAIALTELILTAGNSFEYRGNDNCFADEENGENGENDKLRSGEESLKKEETLGALRLEIDAIDAKVSELLSRRMDVAASIAMQKLKEGTPVKNPAREQIVLDSVEKKAGEEKGKHVREVYRKLIEETCLYEEEIMEGKKLC